MRIKEMPLQNQPRERLLTSGVSVLSDAELLAVIFGVGSIKENAIDMSNRLLSSIGMEKLMHSSVHELTTIPGIGKAKALQLLALFEFSKRHNVSRVSGKPISSAMDVFSLLSWMKDLEQEHFIVLLLDTKNCVLSEKVIAVGTLNSALIHPREVFRMAIKENANSLILAHNHPSGDCNPSNEDLKITEKLVKIGEMLGIQVLDHVIIGKEFWSFEEAN